MAKQKVRASAQPDRTLANQRLKAVAAVLTPPGTAGVATIAVVGSDAWNALAPLFRRLRGQPLAAAPDPGSYFFGKIGPPPGDEVVLAARPDQSQPWFEIHCHGGTQVVEWVLELLAERQVTITNWKKLIEPEPATLRTIALRNLTKALTLRTASILLDQVMGAFDRAVRRTTELFDQGRVNAASDALNRLLRWSGVGAHLTTPWRVALCGPPNVGKSSLINAVAGFRRAVVTPMPGTTRDVVATIVALDGWPIELLDTAGAHPTIDPLENAGIRLGQLAAQSADLVVWVMDQSDEMIAPPLELKDPLLVINKCDLPQLRQLADLESAVQVSALTASGIDELCAAIVRRLVPQPPTPGEGLPFNAGLVRELQEARSDVIADRTEQARSRLAALIAQE